MISNEKLLVKYAYIFQIQIKFIINLISKKCM